MRRFCLLLLLAFAVPSAFAARKLSVQELEQYIGSLQGKPETEQAYRIADLDLTERLSPVRQARLMSLLPAGKSRQALLALADRSGFQSPPAAEMPARPVPDLAEQKRIMGLTASYVAKTVPLLPNFYATRSTTRFEDTPLLNRGMKFIPFEPLHQVGSFRATSLYRDGREVAVPNDPKAPKLKVDATGLTSWGEFGPILSTVLLDAARSTLAWSHWEQNASGPLAVFSYAVPKEKSHYEVKYCCIAQPGAADRIPYHELAGYHGLIGVDPATGAILRLTVESDMRTGAPIQYAALLVEYGPVELGGRNYICPQRAVSLSQAEKVQLSEDYAIPEANALHPQQWALNHVVFEDYHLFRAEARITTETLPEQSADEASSMPATVGEILTAPEDENKPGAEAVTAPSPTRETPEIAMEPASELPDAPPVSRLSGGDDAFTMQTVVRLVDVPVTVYDRKGHTVTELSLNDFELLDNGIAQPLRYFTAPAGRAVAVPDPSQSPSLAPDSGPIFSNRSASAPVIPGQRTSPLVILLDAANLSWADLDFARSEVLRYLTTVPPDQPVGLYAMRRLSFEILTEPSTDRDTLSEILKKWMPNAQDLANAQDEQQRNRQRADTANSIGDLSHGNSNGSLDPENAASSQTAQAALAATVPIRSALLMMTGIARHLATLAGHKTLVWVSSGNALVDWSSQTTAHQDMRDTHLDPLSLTAREALNEARVSIFPLDASQLQAGGTSAESGSRNMQAVGKTGRETYKKKQDTWTVAPQIRAMAEATGGHVLRRSTDIAAELDQIAGDGAATYLLGFLPTAPADNAYHQINVQLTSHKDLTLRYRTGYLYSREPVSLRDRFRAAVWTPTDAGDLGSRATIGRDAEGCLIHIVLSARDLDLTEEKKLLTGRLYVFLVDRDDTALKAKVTGQIIALNLWPATFERIQKEGLAFDQRLDSPLEGSSLRIVLVDDATGKMGSITIPATALRTK